MVGTTRYNFISSHLRHFDGDPQHHHHHHHHHHPGPGGGGGGGLAAACVAGAFFWGVFFSPGAHQQHGLCCENIMMLVPVPVGCS